MGIKMDKTGITVCSVVGSLGVLSAIFGFSAEGTKLTPYTILALDDECIYPSNPALALAVCAIIFLMVAQITITAVGGCCGCCKSRAIPSETRRIVAVICAVVSWIAAVIAVVLLGEGASWNANVVRVGPAPFCPYLKDGILAGGGVLSLVATALGITSFVMLRSRPAGGGADDDVVAAPPAAVVAVVNAGAVNGGQGQQLPAGMAIGHPPAGKPDVVPVGETIIAQPQFPSSKPHHGYGQAQVAPATTDAHHAQAGYVHAVPQQQTPLPQFPPQSYAPNQQFSPPPPPKVHPMSMAAVLPAAAAGVQLSPLPQAAAYPPQPQQPSYSPQHPAILPQAAAYPTHPQVPIPPPAQQEAGEQTTTGNLFVAGAKLLMRVAEHSLSSSNNNTGATAADPATTTIPGGDTTFPPSSMGGDSTTAQDAAAVEDTSNYA